MSLKQKRGNKNADYNKRILCDNRISGHNDTDAVQDGGDTVHPVREGVSVRAGRCRSGYPAKNGRECAETEDETKRI